eukprot:4523519-Amphidinium_carterae.2
MGGLTCALWLWVFSWTTVVGLHGSVAGGGQEHSCCLSADDRTHCGRYQHKWWGRVFGHIMCCGVAAHPPDGAGVALEVNLCGVSNQRLGDWANTERIEKGRVEAQSSVARGKACCEATWLDCARTGAGSLGSSCCNHGHAHRANKSRKISRRSSS